MRFFLTVMIIVCLLSFPVSALDITAPTVPEAAMDFMPSSSDSFGAGLLELFRDMLMFFRPDLKEASRVCFGIIGVLMVLSLVRAFSGSDKRALELAQTLAISLLLLDSSNMMIRLGSEAVTEISEYGKLLIPVMSMALAAQGGITGSGLLYAGTVVFDTLLGSLISKILVPMVYLYLALAVAASATGEEMLKSLKGSMKWLMTWSLKIILYVFTGYMGITGVVSGTTDAAALKAAKLTISGFVPVVGGILSDASEAVLVSAGTVKNAAGLYGLFAILAIWMNPFLKIGAHYLLLKATSALGGVFGSKSATGLIEDFTFCMGILLAMSGSVCLMLMISTVCFMKGAV